MPASKGKHLTKENREVIEEGIISKDSARKIAKRIDVSASTVTREVKQNRILREKKETTRANLSVRCIHYRDCQISAKACKNCSTKLTTCKHCKTRSCIDTCSNYERKMCPTTAIWPYVCPAECRKKSWCGYPKARYRAHEAELAYKARLVSSREGIGISQDELDAMNEIVGKLTKQGHSFAAIWDVHKDSLPVCSRTAYNYQERGILTPANIELPRKVKIKSRKKDRGAKTRDRVDRTGRTYADFQSLALEDQVRVVQVDSVEGYEENAQDFLSMHFVARIFQLYLLKKHASALSVVTWLDNIERSLGSREAFELILGIILGDRGIEFDDWEGMERSCLEPGKRRCKVFYCDAMKTNQKSQAERNHEQLRRILPKKRSDFDLLSVWDAAVLTSHVNSYPIASRPGKCGFDLVENFLPQALFDTLGIARVAPDDVILKPYLLKHATTQ